MSPGKAIKVLLTNTDNMKECDSGLRQKEQSGLCDNPHLAIFLNNNDDDNNNKTFVSRIYSSSMRFTQFLTIIKDKNNK